MRKVNTWLAVAAAALSLAAPLAAHAAGPYPDQPLKLIVPFPPGGGTDTMARFLSHTMSEKFQWDMIIDNRPGAGGTVGLSALARAPATGYIAALGETSNLSINPYLYSNIAYDVQRDFVPVVSVASQPMVLLVGADAPYDTVKQLIDHGKANPGTLTVGNAGTGTVGDITGRLFAKEAGLELLHVPYKGAAPAMNDLLGGRVDMFFASSPATMPHAANPRIKMLAITTLEPVPQFPGVEPLARTIPGFEAAARNGILVPAGTPQEVVETLNARVNASLQDPALKEKIMAQGNLVLGGTPDDFAQRIAQDSAKWSRIIKEANLSIQ